MEALAPAKLNLGLRIRGRRSDGYHELESLFVPLSLADRVRLRPSDRQGIAVAVSGPAAASVPAGAENLVARAARAFCEQAGIPGGLHIALEKHVPSPGGMGGGSSDAGAVLRLLAERHPGALDAASLHRLALGLGADVPYFLRPVPALVEGIGERITPVEALPAWPVVWAHPGDGDGDGGALATPRVFAAYDADPGTALTPSGAASSIRRLLELQESEVGLRVATPAALEPEGLRQLLVNDLEPAATRLCPAVGRLREAIEASGALASSMSGSGPTVFGVFADAETAEAVARQLQGVAARVESTTTVPSN